MRHVALAHTALAAAGAALAASCGTPTDALITQLNYNRPVDVAFACYGDMIVTADGAMHGQQITTAQPAAACNTQSPQISPVDPATGTSVVPPLPDGQQGLPPSPYVWYAFVLQSASGTVEVARMPAKPSDAFSGGGADNIVSLDGDHLTPGNNAISIGEDPVAIATDASGCYEVTANAGTCDLTVLDVTTASKSADPPNPPGYGTSPILIERRPVINMAGVPIRSKPAAMVAQDGISTVGNLCPLSDSKSLAPQGLVYIAYPGCHLVAAVDMSDGISGRVVGGVQFDSTGTPNVLAGAALANLTCPAECDGMPATPGVRPVALDRRSTTLVLSDADPTDPATHIPSNRIAVGAENSSLLTMIDLDTTPSAPPLPSAVSQLALEDESVVQGHAPALGLTAVSLSPVISMGGDDGNVRDTPGPGGVAQFVYAVANDSTVRVAQVLNAPVNSARPAECETQFDSRFARYDVPGVSATTCLTVGAPTTPPRRSGAKGPGIELIDPGVPTSVAIFKGLSTAPAMLTQTSLVGYFAVITSTSGSSYVVNINDVVAHDNFQQGDPINRSPALIFPHQLRDSFFNRGAPPSDATTPNQNDCNTADPVGNTLSGGPRTSSEPARIVPPGTTTTDWAIELPAVQETTCIGPDTVAAGNPVSELQFGASVEARDAAYPDLRNIQTEGWAATWEGPLSANNSQASQTLVDGPQVRSGQMVVDSSGMRLLDPSQPFCEMGVEPFDIVQFRGCNPGNGNSDCPPAYTCYVHPDSKVSGIGSCMLAGEAARLADACGDFLKTMRRYTTGTVGSGALTLLPRKHELYVTPLDGCVSDDQCNTLAQYAAANNSSADPFLVGKTPSDVATQWSCQTDDQRTPINSDPALNKRCVQTCKFHKTCKTPPDPNDPCDVNGDGTPDGDGKDRDSDCSPGTICVGAEPADTKTGAAAVNGICMEGVLPPQSCVNGPQSFDVRASEAFTVIGSISGYVHPFIVGANGTCQRDPAASRIQIGRIPLKAPECGAVCPLPPGVPTNCVDRFTGQKRDATGAFIPGQFDPNPCSITVQHSEFKRPILPGVGCAPDPTGIAAPATRMAPAIRFSNRAMTFHLVDPYTPRTCPQDQNLGPGNISIIPPGGPTFNPTPPGYSLAFSQKAGFSPMTVPITPVFPVKVVRGPGESLWILDDGDDLLNQLGSASTEGQVFRVESVNINIFTQLQ